MPPWLSQTMPLWLQAVLLVVMPLPMFVFGWTIAKEEVAREPREFFDRHHNNNSLPWICRKLCYMPTCEFCASAWMGLLLMSCIRVRLFVETGRFTIPTSLVAVGDSILAVFSFMFTWGCLVGVTWGYISLFGMMRTDINKDKATTKFMEGARPNGVMQNVATPIG